MELATTVADLDLDGVPEIYVAVDDRQRVVQYRPRDGGFERTELFVLSADAMTFSIESFFEPVSPRWSTHSVR
jgi:hypothetical protein